MLFFKIIIFFKKKLIKETFKNLKRGGCTTVYSIPKWSSKLTIGKIDVSNIKLKPNFRKSTTWGPGMAANGQHVKQSIGPYEPQ